MKAITCLLLILSVVCFPSGSGTQTVATSGTPVQLYVTNPPTKAVICTITAQTSNTGVVYVGFTSAVSAASKSGTPLTAGNSYICQPNANAAFWNLGEFWLDSTVSGDKVSFSWK